MEDLETSAALAFHGVEYVVTVAVERQELLLQVEVEDAAATSGDSGNGSGANVGSSVGDCWTARFPAAYVEELTRKTGNYKRFPVFVSMLLSALAHRSDAVFVDLLTAADLELYRKRKMGKAGGGSDTFGGLNMGGNSSSNGGNKRYLILTYAVEFDRVHYPLPLALVQTPTPNILQRTIRRLRQAIAAKKADPQGERRLADENAALREENRCLKNTLKQYCGGGGVVDAENVDPASNQGMKNVYTDASSIDLQRELEASIEENKELLGIYQQYREEAAQEMARLKAEIRQLKMPKAADDEDERKSLMNLKQEVEQERLDARRKLKESSETIEETLVQMVDMKAQLEETQLKNRELMRQLAILRAKSANQNETISKATASPIAGRSVGASNRRAMSATQQLHRQPRTGAARGRGLFSDGMLHQQTRRPSFGYRSSDDERESTHSSTGSHSSYNPQRQPAQQRRVFRRFDPTAYQLEKERKQQQQRSRSPAVGNGTGRRNFSANGGYASDSSAGGGCSSADSRGSNASSRSTRSRRRLSVRRQREIDARLASPKRTPATESELPPRFCSPMPRPGTAPSPSLQGRSTSRGRSPSPARPVDAARSVNRGASPAPSAASVGRSQSPRESSGTRSNRKVGRSTFVGSIGDVNATRDGSPVSNPLNAPAGQQCRRQQQQKLQQKQRALLMDTSMDSFSDIDDRLTALQQFLKEAKQGTGGAERSAARSTAAAGVTQSSR